MWNAQPLRNRPRRHALKSTHLVGPRPEFVIPPPALCPPAPEDLRVVTGTLAPQSGDAARLDGIRLSGCDTSMDNITSGPVEVVSVDSTLAFQLAERCVLARCPLPRVLWSAGMQRSHHETYAAPRGMSHGVRTAAASTPARASTSARASTPARACMYGPYTRNGLAEPVSVSTPCATDVLRESQTLLTTECVCVAVEEDAHSKEGGM